MIMNLNKTLIRIPETGSVVTRLRRGDDEKELNYPCDVYVVSGNYMVGGRISNFWYWKRVLPDGTLSETENGYGKFVQSENEYDVTITVSIK